MTKTRSYLREWADKKLIPSSHGDLKKLCLGTGVSDTSARRYLRGGIYSDIAYRVRKAAYELYGYGFLNR